MKKLVYFLLVFPIVLIGQTTTENYVQATSYNVAVTAGNQSSVSDADKIASITYVDGLGRPLQTVDHRAGGGFQDIISVMQYDHLGRQTRQYLPYADANQVPANTTLDYTDNATLLTNLDAYYLSKYPADLNSAAPNPYQEIRYELSPQSRELEVGAAGESWKLDPSSDNDHTIKMEYSANDATEVKLFTVALNADYVPTLVDSGSYFPAASLTKVTTKDENWKPTSGSNHTAIQYTDKYGRVVLKRTYNGGVAHDTHYVFDVYGNLSFVIPPQVDVSDGISSDELEKFCYQYQYDYRNRPVEKKLPGKAREYLVYDALDRPVLTQDGNLKANGQWLFTKYDNLGRVAYTGIYTTTQTRADLVMAMSGVSTYNEVAAASISIGGTSVFYTNNAFPNDAANMELLSISYYDGYTDLPSGYNLPSEVFSQSVTSELAGMQTVVKTKVLNTTDWITQVMAYDQKGRTIYNYTDNEYLDTQDEFFAKLDFVGNTLHSLSEHTKGTAATLSTWDYYTYDHRNRLLTHLQDFENHGLQLIADNTYDELGQLERKKVGGKLFASGYTDVSPEITISTTGRIEKDLSATEFWNTGVATIGKIFDNGGIKWTVPEDGNQLMVGLNDYSEDGGFDDFDFAIYVRTVVSSGNNYFETRVYNSPVGSVTRPWQPGDEFAIEKNGDQILFKKNGVVVETYNSPTTLPPLLGDVSIRTPGGAIENLNFYATTLDKVLQEVDYTYNIRGWLKEINPVAKLLKKDNTDLWGFQINYTDVEGLAAGAVPLYNGNIAQTIWQTSNDDVKRSYTYSYDNLNRITKANSSSGSTLATNEDYGLWSVSYDKVGNIQGLFRNGNVGTGRKRWDELVYQYDGNRLTNVTDNATGGGASEGFNDGNDHTVLGGVDDYTYDINGNMVSDANKGITLIEYNHLNLPRKIVFNAADGETSGTGETIVFTYDANGTKLAKRVINSPNTTDVTTYYAGGFKYKGTDLEFVNHPEGYIHPVSVLGGGVEFQYVFQYKDHLGNIRLSYTDSNNDGAVSVSEIVEESNYYPFGLKHKGYNNVISGGNDVAQNWKFLGQERTTELGLLWDTYRYRNYMPDLGRFFGVDPISGEYTSISTYQFAHNNPVWKIEIEGLEGTTTSGGDNSAQEFYPDPMLQNMPQEMQYATAGSGNSFEKTLSRTSNLSKGLDQGLNQRFQIEPTRGATKTGIRDTKAGRVSNKTGKPVGEWSIRVDNPHPGRGGETHHININPKLSGKPDPHTPISKGTANALGTAGKVVDGVGRVAKPLAIVTDATRIAIAIDQDGGAIGQNTVETSAKVGGGWAGAILGASLGAEAGALGGTFITPGPGTAIGGFGGGVIGGIIGAFAGETAVENMIESIKNPEPRQNRGSLYICFVAGTEITMSDFSVKNIENVKQGDFIKTYNTSTGAIENKRVILTESSFSETFVRIEFSDGTININTLTHPYFIKDKGWSSYDSAGAIEKYGINVNTINKGDIAIKINDDNTTEEIEILNITLIEKAQKTYNLSNIEDNHNFFANGVLVHNRS